MYYIISINCSCYSFICTVETILDFPCVIVSHSISEFTWWNLTCHVGQAQYEFYLPSSQLEKFYLLRAVGQPLISGPDGHHCLDSSIHTVITSYPGEGHVYWLSSMVLCLTNLYLKKLWLNSAMFCVKYIAYFLELDNTMGCLSRVLRLE